jgi:hypothetical protein
MMTKSLTYKQLAFILEIKPIEALEKIIYAHCKIKGTSLPRSEDKVSGYLYSGSTYPAEMEIGTLAEHLNLPDLQMVVDDIQNNFLKRPASKKWILSDYPEKQLETKLKSKIKIPPVLRSLLYDQDIDTIKREWKSRHGINI